VTAQHTESIAQSGPLSSIDKLWYAASKGLIQEIVREQQRVEQAALQGTSVEFQKQLLSFKLAQLVSGKALSEQAARRLRARIAGEPVPAHDNAARSHASELEQLIDRSLSTTLPEGKTGTITTGLAVVGGAVVGYALGGPGGAAAGVVVAIAAAAAEV
jgi:hypothetical protein